MGVGGGNYAEVQRTSVDRPGSTTEWTEIRSTLARKKEEVAHLALFEEEEETLSTSYASASDYSSSETASASAEHDRVARLAMGIGRVDGVLASDATEAERVEYALDVIDRTIDQWFEER